MRIKHITCRCGQVRLAVTGPPILSSECHCTSCETAAERFAALPGAVDEREGTGGTPFVLMRKDRVTFETGVEHLAEVRLTPESSTRRVVATCCMSPVFLEFKGSHWLSLYAARWPEADRLAMDLRTMTKDRPDGAPPLPEDIPNPKSHNTSFMLRLLGAWIAMGFRSPLIEEGRKELVADV